jgi:hypothetical protein
MPRRLAATVGALLKNLNWACWLGQHRWQAWFELKVCGRCEQVGFRIPARRSSRESVE